MINQPFFYKQQSQPSVPSSTSASVSAQISQPTPDSRQHSTESKAGNLLSTRLFDALVANWPMIVVGAVGIWAALRTLGVIHRQTDIMQTQTKATEIAANAAQSSAQAVINSERPWIDVRVQPHPTIVGNYIFRAANTGRTPAVFRSGQAAYIFRSSPSSLPVPPLYDDYPFPIPNNSFLVHGEEFEIYPHPGVSPESIIESRLKQGTLKADDVLIFYGRIIYDDVFEIDKPGYIPHETRWCYACLENGRRFVRVGPDGYNIYT